MTAPGWWPAVLLALAAYRWTRLIGWDDWPPIAWVRARLIGQVPGEASDVPPCLHEFGIGYRRPLLAHLIHCPFCLGFWNTLWIYGAWLATPRATLLVMAPFAISAAVGLIAKNWDP